MTKDNIVSQIVILDLEQHRRLVCAPLELRRQLIIEMCALSWHPEQLISTVEEPSDNSNRYYYSLTIDKNAIVKHPYEIGSVVMTISEEKSFSWTDGLKVVMTYDDDKRSVALAQLDVKGQLKVYEDDDWSDKLRMQVAESFDEKFHKLNIFWTSVDNTSIKKTNLTYNLSADGF